MFPGFLLGIAKLTSRAEPGAGAMSIIIRRPYRYLEEELRAAFDGQEDVKVIVDRRLGERRTRVQSVASERRRADQRALKRQLVEVILQA
jgi:hypothetical protein